MRKRLPAGMEQDAAVLLAKVKRHGFRGDKGFVLGGHVGNGKTTRLRLISEVFTFIKYWDARDLSLSVAGLESADDRFREACRLQMYGEVCGDPWHYSHDLIIDDLGTESSSQSSYGNRADVMARVIDARYGEWDRHGWRTYFATNLSSNDLKRAYGERTFSRLFGMCEFIFLPGGDRRLA